MSLNGVEVTEIAAAMGIARSTVLGYLGQAARESSRDTLNQLAVRMGMGCAQKRKTLFESIQAVNDAVKEGRIDPQEYMRRYEATVKDLLPCLGEDWVVVKGVHRSIQAMLQ